MLFFSHKQNKFFCILKNNFHFLTNYNNKKISFSIIFFQLEFFLKNWSDGLIFGFTGFDIRYKAKYVTILQNTPRLANAIQDKPIPSEKVYIALMF